MGEPVSAPLRIRRRSTRKSGIRSHEDGLKPYFDRLIKLIPAEIISVYTIGKGIIPAANNAALLGFAAFCLLGLIWIRAWGTADQPRRLPPDWIHVLISAGAFVVWVYSLGEPFISYGIHEPWIGSLLLLAFTFVVPLVYKGPDDDPIQVADGGHSTPSSSENVRT